MSYVRFRWYERLFTLSYHLTCIADVVCGKRIADMAFQWYKRRQALYYRFLDGEDCSF